MDSFCMDHVSARYWTVFFTDIIYPWSGCVNYVRCTNRKRSAVYMISCDNTLYPVSPVLQNLSHFSVIENRDAFFGSGLGSFQCQPTVIGAVFHINSTAFNSFGVE